MAASKGNKKYANKKVRRHKYDLPLKGNGYKKLYESYDIIDWINYWSWSEAREQWETADENSWLKKHHPTLQEYYNYWRKCCLNK